MASFIPFTKDDIARASQTDLEEFLRSRGEVLKRSGSEWQWLEGSDKVTIRWNKWFHQYEQVGGDAIKFVQRFYNLLFPEAVAFLLQEQGMAHVPMTEPQTTEKKAKPFALPSAHSDMRRVYAYLMKQRFIDREVISFFAHQKMLYEDAKYHNAVFVGFDKRGIARHAHKRGTYSDSSYKGNVSGSLPEHSFHWIGNSSRLYAFEAPIDLLSYVSLHPVRWQEQSYLALCCVGTQGVLHQLQQNPQLHDVVVCTDHDEAGIEAFYRIYEEVMRLGSYTVRQELAHNKDWNEDIKEQHGIEPIPGSEHPKIEFLRELCQSIMKNGLSPCPPWPLERMQELFNTLKRASPYDGNTIQEQACKLAALALSFCTMREKQIGIQPQIDQFPDRLLALYKPHRDHCGYNNRLRELKDTLSGLVRVSGPDCIYTLSEFYQQIDQTMAFALHCLRLCAYVDQQQQVDCKISPGFISQG